MGHSLKFNENVKILEKMNKIDGKFQKIRCKLWKFRQKLELSEQTWKFEEKIQ